MKNDRYFGEILSEKKSSFIRPFPLVIDVIPKKTNKKTTTSRGDEKILSLSLHSVIFIEYWRKVSVGVMSIGITEKRILYDNPCAPIVKFSPNNSHSNSHDDTDEEDMTDEQPTSTSNNDIILNPTLGLSSTRCSCSQQFDFVFLGEHPLKSLSLEDLVKSFDNTIHECFQNEQTNEYDEEAKTPQEDLIASSKFV